MCQYLSLLDLFLVQSCDNLKFPFIEEENGSPVRDLRWSGEGPQAHQEHTEGQAVAQQGPPHQAQQVCAGPGQGGGGILAL